MSLYFGNDTNTSPILHITSGSSSEVLMKSPVPVPETVFHSNLRYISFKKYDCSFIAGPANVYDGPYPVGTAQPDYSNGVYIELPIDCFNDIVVYNRNYVIEINRSGVKTLDLITMYNTFPGGRTIFFSADHSSFSTTILSSTHPKIFIKGTGITGIRIYVLNTSNQAYVPPVVDNSGVLAGDGSITVNGTDLLNFSYLSTAIINSADSTPTIGSSTVQFINSDTAGTSIELVKDGVDYVIRKGNDDIFNSALGPEKVFFKEAVYGSAPAINLYFNTSQSFLISSTIPVGSVFLLSVVVADVSQVNESTIIMRNLTNESNVYFYWNTTNIGGSDTFICKSDGNLWLVRTSVYSGASGYEIRPAINAYVTIFE